jgi:carboxyl-terminal processing protease
MQGGLGAGLALPWIGMGPTLAAEPASGELSALPWSVAFSALLDRMAVTYPFTDWKRIDWRALRQRYAPLAAAAERKADGAAFYLAVRQMLSEIPDGHVRVRGGDFESAANAQIAGGFGFTLWDSADGELIVGRVLKGSTAEAGGLESGARILSWNGKPPEAAVEATPLWLNEKSVGTSELRRRVRVRFAARAPVGRRLDLTFAPVAGGPRRRVALTAQDDGRAMLEPIYATAEEQVNPAVWRRLDGGVGYLKITREPSPQYFDLRGAVAKAAEELAPIAGLVLDLRRNSGGDDDTTAQVLGLFHETPRFLYGYQEFDPAAGAFRTLPEVVRTVPSPNQITAPVVVLVSGGTVSAGESLAWCLQRYGRAVVMGYEATAGAYGGTGGEAKMPTGFTAYYPVSRTVDERDRILVEGDAEGRGGVQPDIRLRRGVREIIAAASGQDLEVEAAVAWLKQNRAPPSR